MKEDPLGNKTKLATIMHFCSDFFKENFILDGPLEFKKTFVHIMQEETEIDPHEDDGDMYEGKPMGEKYYSAVLTFNTDYEGGKFYFRTLNKEISPKAGSLIIFRGDKKRDHGVTKLTKGYRVSMPIFFRTLPRS